MTRLPRPHLGAIWRPGLVTTLLGVVCLLLAGQLYREWRLTDPPPTSEMSSVPPGASLPASPATLIPIPSWETLSDMIARPLFAPTRRPPPPAQPQPAAPAPSPTAQAQPAGPPPLNVTLVGTILSFGKQIALMRRHSDGKILQLSVGDTVSDWTVSMIADDRALLRWHGNTQELVLKYGNQGANPAAPSSQAPPSFQ